MACPASAVAKAGLPGDTGASTAEIDRYPLHEVVGEVLATRHPQHRQGDRVVGWASGFDGLMELVVADGNGLAPYDPVLSPNTPSACSHWPVCSTAIEQLPALEGTRWR